MNFILKKSSYIKMPLGLSIKFNNNPTFIRIITELKEKNEYLKAN